VGRGLNVNQKDYGFLSPYAAKGKQPEAYKEVLRVSETIPASTSKLESRGNREL
jgi:hypothetical protein